MLKKFGQRKLFSSTEKKKPEDATIIEETKTPKVSQEKKVEQAEEIKENTQGGNHTLRSDETFNEHKEGEKEVNIDKRTRRPKKVKINFMDDEYLNSEIDKRPDDAKPDDDTFAKRHAGKTTDEIRSQLSREEGEEGSSMTVSDFEQTAKTIVSVVDMIFSTIFRIVAKDTSSAAYTIDAAQKKVVIENLTLCLIKHKSKFRIELLLLIAVLAAWAPKGKDAYDNRKRVVGEKKKELQRIREEEGKELEEKDLSDKDFNERGKGNPKGKKRSNR